MRLHAKWRWLFSLRMKLMAALVPLTAVCLLLAMAGLGGNLMRFFHLRAELETARMGQVIDLALRQFMLKSPGASLRGTLADVERAGGIRRVWIFDKQGRVAHSTDASAAGKVLDKRRDPLCVACHQGRTFAEARTAFVQDSSGAAILRHLRPIANDRECWGCHAAASSLNGVLLLEETTEPYQTALREVRRYLSATGGLTLAALVLVTLLVTTLLVQRPIGRLIAGVRRVGGGDLSARVPAHGRDELAELAGSFNTMAEDLGRSLEEIRNKNAELGVVYSILERLTKTINLTELKEIILQTVLDVFNADRVLCLSLLTPQESGEVLVKARGAGRLERAGYAGDGGGLPAWLPREIAEAWFSEALADPYLTGDRRLAVIPIQAGDRRVALLAVRREVPFGDTEANRKLLMALAAHVAVAFENGRLYTLAISDHLTGLYARRHFDSRAAEALAHPERFGPCLGLIMLDLDRFKSVNDNFGHLAGDEVLRQAGRVLLRSIRFGDSAYRYGGEEFAVLLPDSGGETVLAVAERIRREFEALEIRLDESRSLSVTVSAGIAIFPEHGSSVQELVASADAALYRAKSEGRNRVALAGAATERSAQ